MRRFATATLASLALVGLSACGAQQAPTSAPTTAPAIQAPTGQLSLSTPLSQSTMKTQWWGGLGWGGLGWGGLGWGGLGWGGGLWGWPYWGSGLGWGWGGGLWGWPYYSSWYW